MATSKPQFNVRLDPHVAAAIEQHCQTTGTIKGKLVERMWDRFRLGGPTGLTDACAALESYVVPGVTDRDSAPLYKLYVALQRAFTTRLKET